MRELNLNEISSISGACAKAISELSVLEASNWGLAAWGGYTAGNWASSAISESVVNIGSMLGKLVGYGAHHVAGVAVGVAAASGIYLATQYVTSKVEPYV